MNKDVLNLSTYLADVLRFTVATDWSSICRPSAYTCRPTVASGVVGVVVVVVIDVCNCSQMRTSKCTCLIFGMSIGLDPGYKCTKGIFDRSKFKVTRDMSPTISGWLLVGCCYDKLETLWQLCSFFVWLPFCCIRYFILLQMLLLTNCFMADWRTGLFDNVTYDSILYRFVYIMSNAFCLYTCACVCVISNLLGQLRIEKAGPF